jgi:hypothetical protein
MIATILYAAGQGIETVHLKLSDFKPDEDIMLHLRHEDGDCVPAATLLSKDYMEGLITAKKVVKHDQDLVMDYCEMQCELRELPKSCNFVNQLLTADPAAMARLKGVLVERRVVTCLRQALYGTPTRLYYCSDHKESGAGAKVVAYLKHVQEMCCKKLEESSGVDAVVK